MTNDVLNLLADKRKKVAEIRLNSKRGWGGKNETGINLSFNYHL